jgi:hypothetical protein
MVPHRKGKRFERRNLSLTGSSILALWTALGFVLSLCAQTASPAQPGATALPQMNSALNQSSERISDFDEGLIKLDVVVTDK